MRARELEAYFRDRGVRSTADLDARMRALRKRGMVPTGGRGLNAPQIDAQVAASIVLAITIPDTASDAASGPGSAGRMRTSEDLRSPNFQQLVACAIADPKVAADIAWVRVNQSEKSALVEYDDESQDAFFDWDAFATTAGPFPGHFAEGPQADIDFHMPYILTQEITFSGWLLCVVGLLVQGMNPEEAETKANEMWCGFEPKPEESEGTQ